MRENLVVDKSFRFALEVIGLYKVMIKQNEYVLSKQMLRAGTSVGANVEEAVAGISRKDFTHKMNIACKEARETKYWLKLINESKIVDNGGISSLINQADEMIRILTAIVKTTQGKNVEL